MLERKRCVSELLVDIAKMCLLFVATEILNLILNYDGKKKEC